MSDLITLAAWFIVSMGLACGFAYRAGKHPGTLGDMRAPLIVLFWPIVIVVALMAAPVLIARALGERHRSPTPTGDAQ